jgi:MinD superfamily P-loop ATPase
MREIAVISGKGGTGKTSFVAAFASLVSRPVLADCDVDAADLRLLTSRDLKPFHQEPFRGGFKAQVDPEMCSGCGQCREVCRFEAVRMVKAQGHPGDQRPVINPFACEGCGCCEAVCPEGVIHLSEEITGDLFVSRGRFGPLVHARLHPGEGASGKLVTFVRERAKEIAEKEKADCILIDGSPGIGCPVIASITGTDAVLIVTEPSVSALHDLERVVALIRYFRVPAYLLINKYDINTFLSSKIEEVCADCGVRLLGRIPFDPAFVHAMVDGLTILDVEGLTAERVRRSWAVMQEDFVKRG